MSYLLDIPTGCIMMFSSETPPNGFLYCDGSAVSRTEYVRLFDVIGTTFGVGDGSTTFNLPDFQQRFPLGKAAQGTGATIGDTGGTIDHAHDTTVPADAQKATLNINGITVGQEGTFTSDTENPPFLTITFIIKF